MKEIKSLSRLALSITLPFSLDSNAVKINFCCPFCEYGGDYMRTEPIPKITELPHHSECPVTLSQLLLNTP